jgi:hypothetical protein
VIATVPAPGARAPHDTPVVASVRLAPGASPGDLRLELDGEDVTGRCRLRTDRAHPPRRADLVLAGPLEAGEHEAILRRPAGGAHAWRFTVAQTDDHGGAEGENR